MFPGFGGLKADAAEVSAGLAVPDAPKLTRHARQWRMHLTGEEIAGGLLSRALTGLPRGNLPFSKSSGSREPPFARPRSSGSRTLVIGLPRR